MTNLAPAFQITSGKPLLTIGLEYPTFRWHQCCNKGIIERITALEYSVTKRSTYRVCSLVLTLVFCLFNVGLPIVFAACPMMGRLSEVPSCCAHRGDPTTGLAAISTNCCKTVFAGERNRTEFLGERHVSQLSFAAVTSTVTPLSIPASRFDLNTPVRILDPSPPSEDIPIFTVSLLI